MFPPIGLQILWLVWVIQAVLSAIQVRKFVTLCARQNECRRSKPFTPPTAVIVPFKGVDADLTAGIRALCEQDYPTYELLAVVESEQDPACEILRRELAHYPKLRAKVLVAGLSGPTQGQKVHNQLAAIDDLTSRPADDPDRAEAWVFADSDAVPGPRWLTEMISPLRVPEKTGLTTGYRWLLPIGAPSIWSKWASILNSSVACLLGRDAFNHAWGGSMALLAETAERGKLRDRLVGALCDDYQFTRLSRDLGLRVYFVAPCLVATPIRFDRAGFFNFARRQYLLTRVYAPKLYLFAAAVTTLYVAALFSATAALVVGLLSDPSGVGWWFPAGAIAVVFICNQIRTSMRARVIRTVLGPDTQKSLTDTLRVERWTPPLWMTLHWVIIMSVALSRHMTWRGIRYRLSAPQRVERLDTV